MVSSVMKKTGRRYYVNPERRLWVSVSVGGRFGDKRRGAQIGSLTQGVDGGLLSAKKYGATPSVAGRLQSAIGDRVMTRMMMKL